jgi:NADH-quinone oxidoreductase subunit G
MDKSDSHSSGGESPTLDDIQADLAKELPLFQPILDAAPPADFRIDGRKVPRQSPRSSGRTAMDAKANVSEPKPPDDPDSPLAFSMEGDEGNPPPALIPRYWAPGWNSDQAVNKFQAEIGGSLRNGDPGQRLVEPHSGAQPEFFGGVPPAFEPRDGRLFLAPLFHIFGSEPLSMMSPGIAELTPKPYVALHAEDAVRLSIAEGDSVQIEVDGMTLELPVMIVATLPKGVAGLPSGLPGMEHVGLPAWCVIKKSLPTPPLTPPQNGERKKRGDGAGT